MKKTLFLLILCFFTISQSIAQNYFTFSISLRDINGNPYVPENYNYILYASSNSDSASNPNHFSGMLWRNENEVNADSVYLPPSRRSDSITFSYQVCNGSSLQWVTKDTVIVPGGHMDLGNVNIYCTPHCNANFDPSPAPNGYIHFMNYSKGFQLNYHWNFDDGNTSTSESPTYGYQANDTYDVLLVVTNQYGCIDSVIKSVPVSNSLSCNADFTFHVDSQHTGNVMFTNNSSAGTFNYNWDFGDGNNSSQENPTYTYSQTGTYIVTLYIYNSNCFDSLTKNVYATVGTSCDPSFYWSLSGDSVRFYPNFINPPGTSFKWYFGDGDSSDISLPAHLYTGPYTYNVTLLVIDGNGNECSRLTKQLEIFCNGSPLPNTLSGFLFMNDTIKAGFGSVRFYLIEHDSINATLTAVDSFDFNSVSVNDTAYFSFNPCKSHTKYRVKAALLPGATGYSHYLPTYANQSLFWSQADTFFGSGVWSNIYVPLNLIAGYNPGGPGFIGGYISQGANKSGAALENIQVILLTEDDLPVAYTYSSSAGRYEFDNIPLGTFKVLIEIPGKPSAAHAVELTTTNPSSDNNDFEVNKKDVSTVIRYFGSNKQPISIYPNPASNKLYMDLSSFNGESGTFTITDISGKTMMVLEINAEEEATLEVDISGLKNGVYFISGTIGSSQYNAKFITTK